MKINLVCIGKTDDPYILEGIKKYTDRLKHYCTFELVIIPDIKHAKNIDRTILKQKEGEEICKHIQDSDLIILLDDKGKSYSSIEFANYINKQQVNSVKKLSVVIGGAFGFSEEVYSKTQNKLSLSKMTFSHQIIRIIFLEQLYRAFTIIKGEKYHHE